MKQYEKNTNFENVALKGYEIEPPAGSMIAIAKKKFYVPEKKIIIMEQNTAHELQILMDTSNNRGGLIL